MRVNLPSNFEKNGRDPNIMSGQRHSMPSDSKSSREGADQVIKLPRVRVQGGSTDSGSSAKNHIKVRKGSMVRKGSSIANIKSGEAMREIFDKPEPIKIH